MEGLAANSSQRKQETPPEQETPPCGVGENANMQKCLVWLEDFVFGFETPQGRDVQAFPNTGSIHASKKGRRICEHIA